MVPAARGPIPLDPDGAGPEPATATYFVYDDLSTPLVPAGAGSGLKVGQIILQLDDSGRVTNRYLWGPAVDQILADEQLEPDGTTTVLWTLTDHLNTVRDLALHDPATGATTIVNHLVYDAFGRTTHQTDPTLAPLFTFTARPLDPATGLQNNLNRWYDAQVGRWVSEDPIGFAAADANLYRYCGNTPTNLTDPLGTLPAEMETALRAFAEKENWTPEQLAAARQWLEDLLARARNMPQPSGLDQCWKWAGAVISQTPALPNRGIGVRLQGWYYPMLWNPLHGYLTHATIQITIGDAVFYIDNGWWGGTPGAVYGPDKVSPRVKPFDIQSPPAAPLWWQSLLRIGARGAVVYTPRS